MISAAIIGGSGYTGGELARLLCRHPEIKVQAMTSRQHAGLKVAKAHPFLNGFVDLNFTEKLQGNDYDVVFTATPHGASMDVVPELTASGVKVIDLSGDYRLFDPELYKKWYGLDHRDRENLAKAVYGIPELFRDKIKGAALVANPGCYPTCSSLGLAPLFANGLVEERVIIDAKSGTSGAGAEPTKATHHPNCGASLTPYKVGSHRHMPEIKMILERLSGSPVELIFTPHLVPVVRGMLCTSYPRLKEPMTKEEIVSLYHDFYSGSRFVKFEPIPTMQSVAGSNFVEIGFEVVGELNLVVMSTLDNLVKGASGQAIQNCNIMFGLDEKTGLDFPGLGV
ncbi:MAG TPA: N-acetyl-gamma-glutamyl-phosphate reductase [Methanomassiliicoccales archaeon]